MEKEISIPTPDNKEIHGTLIHSVSKSKKLILFVHGLTGHRNEHIFFNGANYFSKKGYNTFRFDLYGEGKKARNFRNTSLPIHGQDLKLVFDFFKKKGFTKIFLVGHSYGGPTVLLSDCQTAAGIVLWDPTSDPSKVMRSKSIRKENGFRFIDWGIPMLLSDKYYREALKIRLRNTSKLIQKLMPPTKVIIAEKIPHLSVWKKLLLNMHFPNALTVIPGAGHNFNEDGTEMVLFRETLSWIKKFS